MRRIFGALAVFFGWLCIPFSAVLALASSQFFGLGHTEGTLPPSSVYGVSGLIVLWIVIAAAMLTAIPAGTAIIAPRPGPRLYAMAVAMFLCGLALAPDELGRVFSAGLMAGAALFVVAGWLMEEAGPVEATTLGEAALVTAGAGPPWTDEQIVTAPGGPSAASATAAAAAAAGTSARKSRRAGPKKGAVSSMAECPWCSTPITVAADNCPACGAALSPDKASEVAPIPGVTAVAPELREYAEKTARQKKKPSLFSVMLGDRDNRLVVPSTGAVDPGVLRPPSAEVRAEMERLDREIRAARSGAEGEPGPAEPSLELAPPPAEPPSPPADS
jgi:hypothetical protein